MELLLDFLHSLINFIQLVGPILQHNLILNTIPNINIRELQRDRSFDIIGTDLLLLKFISVQYFLHKILGQLRYQIISWLLDETCVFVIALVCQQVEDVLFQEQFYLGCCLVVVGLGHWFYYGFLLFINCCIN